MNAHILIVDDEQNIRRTLRSALEEEGYRVSEASDGRSAILSVEKERPDLILLDIWMPEMDGMEVLKKLRPLGLNNSVIVMSGHGTIETAVKATKLGAYDFIEKPLSLEKLSLVIKNLLSANRLQEENKFLRQQVNKLHMMIVHDLKMRALKEQMKIVAPTNSWILITGENGTGKELVARSIHEQSKRQAKPFVAVICAAIPEELIESELFGLEKGAFTGATSSRRGKFELADQGTLFLDEIGDMSLKTQAKILRVLQERKFERVGGTVTYEVDVRVIVATNKDLPKEIEKGHFREDLYYRLNVIPFHVPALRERKAEIPHLANYFLEKIAEENGKKPKRVSEEAMEILKYYDWPGNVRELKNVIERLFIMTPSDEIQVEDIPITLRESSEENLDEDNDFRQARIKFEKEYLIKKLQEFDGSISKTAQAIGMERTNLHRKIKAYQIEV
ncbi:MAG: sigma-54 dependent transcriptional regulator [Deltaproteobacteria bacterium]